MKHRMTTSRPGHGQYGVAGRRGTIRNCFLALQRAVACFKETWPREDNVLQLPVAVEGGTDKAPDKLKSEVEKLSNRERLVAPAIGLEPMTKRLTVARSTN
jgi:hypothetical protein